MVDFAQREVTLGDISSAKATEILEVRRRYI
jgi:hypothetical protein